MEAAARQELLTLFPVRERAQVFQAARPTLRHHEARLIRHPLGAPAAPLMPAAG